MAFLFVRVMIPYQQSFYFPFLKLTAKASISSKLIANATLKFLMSLPTTKPITMAATNNNWLFVGLNMMVI
jgi:hypothetical protein